MMIRTLACLVCLVAGLGFVPAQAQNQSFPEFVKELWSDAEAKGITRSTFDRAMRGVKPDSRVIAATKRQPEYGKPFGDYVNALASKSRIAIGKRKGREWKKTFDAVEKEFHVERSVLLALWGVESGYGAARGRWDVFRSLATLGYVRFRHPYFRNELLVVMRVMQDTNFPRSKMVSSWAGAMGQTQFMPTNFVDYAIDFSGDGQADIWSNVRDVLGSTGNYLHKYGWRYGETWGFEVSVPKDFDYMKSRASFDEWTRLGVKPIDDKTFPREGRGILFFPAGIKGPAFVVTPNFEVLKEYNNSDAYAIAVGHLADRIAGGPPIQAKWPADDKQLSRDARVALQKKLASLGYRVNEFEAHIDFDLRDNIRAEQKKFGMLPDGTPTRELLDRLGITVR
jgi:membrane-bound lytic murein transglycosylase B